METSTPHPELEVSHLEGRSTLAVTPDSADSRIAMDFILGDPRAVTLRFRSNHKQEGLWSGLRQLLEQILDRFSTEAEFPTRRHLRELSVLLPRFREGQAAHHSLTDLASPTERVRNYPTDRIYRTLHGLADFVCEVRQATGSEPWILVWESPGQAGVLVKRFFREFARRKIAAGGFGLLLVGSVAELEELAPSIGGFDSFFLPAKPAGPATDAGPPSELSSLNAIELEARIEQDPAAIEQHVARLIDLWQKSDTPERALRWQAAALGLYNHLGCYEDAFEFVDPVLDNLDRACSFKEMTGFWHMSRWNIVGNIYGCLNSINQPERAYEVVLTKALPVLSDPCDLARCYYVLAMSCARFLPRKNLGLANQYLSQGLDLLGGILGREETPFLRSFLLNGLAFVRHRQGDPKEAIELCQEGYDNLKKNLDAGTHRLHRSVLFFNIAQVYDALGDYENAIANYSEAIEMDPNYSEYYNDRGSARLRAGRLQEAETDFLHAIELSSPYFEVWTNLGQCRMAMGRLNDAIAAYDESLDLNPANLLGSIGRAQAFHRLGRWPEALHDYDRSIELGGTSAMLLSNRAAVLWELGLLPEAAASLDSALELEPENQEVLSNREFLAAFAVRGSSSSAQSLG